MDDALIGKLVGRFQITRKLGQGGTGGVYLGEQPAIGSRVAIKVLAAEYARDPALLERFFAEARAVNMIKHENIVGVLDLARLSDGRPFIVMEYVDGQTLGHILRHSRTPLFGVASAMAEVLSALAAAHAIGIVHRDVKPDNILISLRGHARIGDFGIAKLARGGSAARTQSGALLGTPAYMAPEQVANATAVDARADIYAAGVMLFEAITGRLPFTGSTFELVRAHAMDVPPPARVFRDDVPAAFEAVIATALEKEPDRRFASAAAMAGALRDAAARLADRQMLAPVSTVEDTDVPRASASRPSGIITPVSPSAERYAVRNPDSLPPQPALVLPEPGTTQSSMAMPVAIDTSSPLATPAPSDADPSMEMAMAPIDARFVTADAPSQGRVPTLRVLPRSPTPPHVPITPAPVPVPRSRLPWLIVGIAVVLAALITLAIVFGSHRNASSTTPPAPGSAREVPSPKTFPVTYDPASVDPIALVPHAEELARAAVPGAELVEIAAYPVALDGTVDIRGTRDPGLHTMLTFAAADRRCVEVVILPEQIVLHGAVCVGQNLPRPRCSLAQVAHALQAGTMGTLKAATRLTYTAEDGHVRWIKEVVVDGDLARIGNVLPDDCR